MDPARSAFWQAIMAAPDDDAPRLIFADWLDENGGSDQAAFIREQVAQSRGAGSVAARIRCRKYVEGMLPLTASKDAIDPGGLIGKLFGYRRLSLAFGDADLPEIRLARRPNDREHATSRAFLDGLGLLVARGFVSGVRCPISYFLYRVWRMFTFAPITLVYLSDTAPTRAPVNPNGHGEAMWCWCRHPQWAEDSEAWYELPAGLFDVLARIGEYDPKLAHDQKYTDETFGFDRLGWRHESRAYAAIKAALVQYGRRVAVSPKP